MTDIQKRLFTLQDVSYRDFQRQLIPNIGPQSIIGVRTPVLRKLAKEQEEPEAFLTQLPHRYFEENQLHSFLISAGEDFPAVIAAVDGFLPYVDNWATCDQLTPPVFRQHREELLPYIRRWIGSDHVYTIRFAIVMLMTHFLEKDFRPEYPELVAGVCCEDYYVRMAVSWYFATALAKQFDCVISYLTEHRLEKWIHNKTIQKAIESYRINPEQKAYLKTLRIK